MKSFDYTHTSTGDKKGVNRREQDKHLFAENFCLGNVSKKKDIIMFILGGAK